MKAAGKVLCGVLGFWLGRFYVQFGLIVIENSKTPRELRPFERWMREYERKEKRERVRTDKPC
jgi:hypothetical protein